MINLFWQTLKVAPFIIAASLLTANSASAQSISADKESVNQTLEQINNYQTQSQDGSLSQVTNVNQLRDVSPTDWAYEALRSLVDRYGCIAGFPNQTYRGNEPLSRYEFAAGLNSCLNQIERLIASSEAVNQEDLDTINRLNQEFEAELATLGGRVDELEGRTATLEDQQFSTTTKLNGEAIFSLADSFGGGVEDVDDSEPDVETTLSSRVRLNLDSSFFGEDRLRTRLEAANITDFGEATGTDSARLGYDENNENTFEINELHYRFPVTEKVTGWVGTTGLDSDDIFSVSNPVLESSGSGALSRFNRRNPVVLRGQGEGAGAGVNVDVIEDKVTLSALYLADDGNASSAAEGEGIFNGSNSAGAQIELTPIENLELAATYIRAYDNSLASDYSGGTTSGLASNVFEGSRTTANKFGLGATYNVGERFVLAGFGGYAGVTALDTENGDGDNASGDVWTWGANVSILDLVKEGSNLTLGGGQLPRFSSSDVADDYSGDDASASYLVEALYQFPLNDNISITPGAYVVLNANHDSTNDPTYVGVLRTTFKF